MRPPFDSALIGFVDDYVEDHTDSPIHSPVDNVILIDRPTVATFKSPHPDCKTRNIYGIECYDVFALQS